MVLSAFRSVALSIFLCLGFGSCEKQESFLPIAKSFGKEFRTELQTVLSQEILSKGVPHAIGFCQEKAIPLTQEFSLRNKVLVSRVTDKARNPKNLLEPTEREVWTQVKENKTKGEFLPWEGKIGGKPTVYLPIVITAECLVCHGKPGSQIQTQTQATLQKLYPNDKATGYELGELRGLLKLQFSKGI